MCPTLKNNTYSAPTKCQNFGILIAGRLTCVGNMKAGATLASVCQENITIFDWPVLVPTNLLKRYAFKQVGKVNNFSACDQFEFFCCNESVAATQLIPWWGNLGIKIWACEYYGLCVDVKVLHKCHRSRLSNNRPMDLFNPPSIVYVDMKPNNAQTLVFFRQCSTWH